MNEELKKILLKLKLDGKILQLGNKYIIFPKDLMLGTVVVSTSGKKYLYHGKEKVNISSNFLNEIILHDVVSFKLNSNNEAEIVSIVDTDLNANAAIKLAFVIITSLSDCGIYLL